MESFISEDGRYEVIHQIDCQGWVQLVEYQGVAPRREVSRVAFPFELIAGLMDKLMFAIPAPVEQNMNVADNSTHVLKLA